MPLATDIRSMIQTSATLTGDPTEVTLSSGAKVEGLPGIASIEDTALGTDGQIAGTERTIRFASTDVLGLEAGAQISWKGLTWRIKHVQILAQGGVTKVFLQEVR